MRIVVALLIVAAITGAVVGWYQWNGNANGPAYRTAAVRRGDIQATINATGTIEPEELVDVGAQVAGRIDSLGQDLHISGKTVDYTSRVEVGTVLAQIDDALYRSQVERAKAGVERAAADVEVQQTKLDQAGRDWDRAQTLRKTQVTTEAEYDLARQTFDAAKAQLAVSQAALLEARSNLHQAEINLGYTTIRSPVKGVIIDRRVNVGQTVVASLNAPSLFLIAKDLSKLQVWASVNEADIGQVYQGQPVSFTVDAFPGELFQGTVAQVRLNASMTQNVVTYTVVVSTDNTSGKLLPYLTADLDFEVASRTGVLLVPNAALNWKPQSGVFIAAGPDPASQPVNNKSATGTPEPGQARANGYKEGQLWILDGKNIRPIKILAGLNDGISTEVQSPELREGMEVIVGEIRPEEAAASTPLLPNISRRKSAAKPAPPAPNGAGAPAGPGGARPQ